MIVRQILRGLQQEVYYIQKRIVRIMTGAKREPLAGNFFFFRTFLAAEVFLNHSGFLDHIQ
jgi:hypothetical protein